MAADHNMRQNTKGPPPFTKGAQGTPLLLFFFFFFLRGPFTTKKKEACPEAQFMSTPLGAISALTRGSTRSHYPFKRRTSNQILSQRCETQASEKSFAHVGCCLPPSTREANLCMDVPPSTHLHTMQALNAQRLKMNLLSSALFDAVTSTA
eukprot:201257-Amphidinium_carterae.1